MHACMLSCIFGVQQPPSQFCDEAEKWVEDEESELNRFALVQSLGPRREEAVLDLASGVAPANQTKERARTKSS